jgi:hypothetical protein
MNIKVMSINKKLWQTLKQEHECDECFNNIWTWVKAHYKGAIMGTFMTCV